MLKPVMKDIFSISSNDAELGVELVGHVVVKDGHIIVIDPPMVPGLPQALDILGKVDAVIITSFGHLRGAPFLARLTGATLFIPQVKDTPRLDRKDFIRFHHLENAVSYDEETVLPMGLKATYVRGEPVEGNIFVNEMLLSMGKTVFGGDVARGEKEKLIVFPQGIFPDPDGKLVSANKKALSEVLKKLNPENYMGGHGEPVIGHPEAMKL